jgi:hypothetical protein
MNENREHPDFEVLSDHFDGYLSGQDAALVAEHLAVCGSCAATYKTLGSLVAEASELPKSVLPGDDLWVDLRTSLENRKEIVLPSSRSVGGDGAGSTRARHASRRMIALLAVAAVVLILLSSGITAVVLRKSDTGRFARDATPTRVEPGPTNPRALLPAGFRQTENEFNRTIEELQLAVDTQRGQLSPETIRIVDRSLAVVDSAITEARAALLADPNNQMLIDLLSASYQRKLDLLRRTSELGSRT